MCAWLSYFIFQKRLQHSQNDDEGFIKLIYRFVEVINLGTDDRALIHMAVRILDRAHEAIYS